MHLAYVSTKNYTSSTADHVYIKKMGEAFSKQLHLNFTMVINDDRSLDELEHIESVEKLGFSKHRRALQFFLHFPMLHKKLQALSPGEQMLYMANDKYLLAIFCFYKSIGYSLRVCSDWHVVSASWIDRYVSQQSDFCTCVTMPLKNLLMEKYNIPEEKILFTPNAIDLDIFGTNLSKEDARTMHGLPLDKTILGYYGRFKTMGMGKGISEIIQALAQLPDSYIFVAAGGLPQDVEEYKNIAEKHGVSERVILYGNSTQHELAEYQRASDVLLMPFPYTYHYAYIMSPMKMFEYMAARRPIIATDLPSVRDVLTSNRALLIPPDDVPALTNAIKKLSEEPALGEELSSAAYTYVRARTWDVKATEILHFFKA